MKDIEEIKERWKWVETELSHGSNLCLQLGDECWQDIQVLLSALEKAEEKVRELVEVIEKWHMSPRRTMADFDRADMELYKLIEKKGGDAR